MSIFVATISNLNKYSLCGFLVNVVENNSPKTGHGSCVTPAAIASVHPVWAAIVALTELVTSAANAPSDICRGSERPSYSHPRVC
jgi:hypothetical protein